MAEMGWAAQGAHATGLVRPGEPAVVLDLGHHQQPRGERIAQTEEFAPAMQKAIESGRSAVLDVSVDPTTDSYFTKGSTAPTRTPGARATQPTVD